jgi:hypothetical protein
LNVGAGVPTMLINNESIWPADIFEIVDLHLQFQDWLFSLEGFEVTADPSKKSSTQGLEDPGHDVCWYAMFWCMQFVGCETKAISRRDGKRRISNPVQNLTMSSVFSSKPMYLEQRIYVTVVKQGSEPRLFWFPYIIVM